MDEELEQRGVTPESFFDQATETREMVQTVQKTSNSNLSLLNELKERVRKIEVKLFDEEDRRQKEEMEARVKEQNEKAEGATLGDKEGVKDPEQKGLMGQVGSFLSNLVGGLVGGAVGFTLSGIGGLIGGTINLGKKALDLGKNLREKLFGKKKDKKKKGGKVKVNQLLGTVEEEGKDEDKEKKGKGMFGGMFGGIKNLISDFDETPGSRKTKDTKEIEEKQVEEKKPKFYADYIKEGAKIEDMGPGNFLITYPDGRENFISTVGKGGRGNTVEEKFNDYVMVDAAQKKEEKIREEERKQERLEFGKKMYKSFPDRYNEDGTRKEKKSKKNKKKKNIFGFNQGGLVDSVPAMLTPGEFVVTKDAVDKVGADTLKGLNASVGATNKPSFLGSIGTDDEGNLKKFMKFGDKTESELTSSDGSFTMKNVTDMSGGGLDETTTTSYNKTFTEKDGTVTTFEEKQIMRERISSIGVPDLIEHKDQLLGEIHKLKGFENVTIDQVITSTTGIPKDKLLDILLKSDAQKATSEKEDKAYKEDLKARGIKPGQGFNISANDEVGRSLAGTMGYRMGQIMPDTLVTSTTSFLDKSKSTSGVKPKFDPLLSDLSASINASVKGYNEGGLVGSSIAPIIESKNESGEMELIQNLSQSVDSNSQNINVIQAQNTAMNPPNNNPQTTVPAEPSNTTFTEIKNTDAPIPFAVLLKQNAQRYLNLGNNAMVIS